MLSEIITSGLVLAFGYAYPALECFRTVEKSRVEIQELRFWCQYWIIVAVITVIERIGDIFISWLPLYSEAKLALFIYMWYPQTKGVGHVYETMLRPFVGNHETDIDRILQEFKMRIMDLAIYYWHNCTELGQEKVFEVLHYVASRSANMVRPNPQPLSHFMQNVQNQAPTASAPPIPPPSPAPSGFFRRNKHPPQSPTSRRVVVQPPKAELVQVNVEYETDFIHEDMSMMDEDNGLGPNDVLYQSGNDQKLHAARFRLGRSKPPPQNK